VPGPVRIGVPKETVAGERRVALVPDVARNLAGAGHDVVTSRSRGDVRGRRRKAMDGPGVERYNQR